jgi:hypothetical protein
MFKGVVKNAKRATKLAVFCLTLQALNDYHKGQDNFIVETMRVRFVKDVLNANKETLQLIYPPIYEEEVKTLRSKVQEMPFNKKVLDVFKLENAHSSTNHDVEKYIRSIEGSINEQNLKIGRNTELEKKIRESVNQILEIALTKREELKRRMSDEEKYSSLLKDSLVN